MMCLVSEREKKEKEEKEKAMHINLPYSNKEIMERESKSATKQIK